MEDCDDESNAIANRWCKAQDGAWDVIDEAGRGGTAPVFTVTSPQGLRALKLFDSGFSTKESEKRIDLQCERLSDHDCPQIVKVMSGGKFEDRLFLLMEKAEGAELEKKLADVPRDKIRGIVDQVARAVMYLRGIDLCHRDIKSANIFISGDFERIKLLDLSVIRDINDPVGLGTDHGDSLPVVATSRYSPPDYLFRLTEPSPELWHALDIYQLGGLLHDLIMREPMFEAEYQRTKDNRYRFAWVVATQEPLVRAADVDSDLLLLARRALDKDPIRRSSLRLRDFFDDARIRKQQAMEALGAQTRQQTLPVDRPLITEVQFEEILTESKKSIRASLSNLKITCSHDLKKGTGGPWSRELEFCWGAGDTATEAISNIIFKLTIEIDDLYLAPAFIQTAKISGLVDDIICMAEKSLPGRLLGENIARELADDAISILPDLAMEMQRSSSNEEV